MNELRTILSDVVTRLFTDRVTKDLIEAAETGAWPDGRGRSFPSRRAGLEAPGATRSSWRARPVVTQCRSRSSRPS